MPKPVSRPRITVEAYLEGEKVATERHVFINGEVVAMTGATKMHNRLTRRLARLFDDRLAGGPCEAFSTDVKVRITTLNDDRFYYPDLHVECAPLTPHEYYSERPVLILEVLSESTERGDRSDKFYAYRRLPSLMDYVLVAQDAYRVEVYRRAMDWDLEIYGEGQRFHLAALDGELSVDDIYRDILPPSSP